MEEKITAEVETDNETTRTTDADAVAFVHDEEGFGTRWTFTRVSPTVIEERVERFAPDGRVDEVVPDPTAALGQPEVHDVDEDISTSEFAREVADADPELSVEEARKHFEEEEEEVEEHMVDDGFGYQADSELGQLHIMRSTWQWDRPSQIRAISTEDGADWTPEMEHPTIWAVIETNKGAVAVALRRVSARTAEVETFSWRANTLNHHAPPTTFDVDADASFIEIAERWASKPVAAVESVFGSEGESE